MSVHTLTGTTLTGHPLGAYRLRGMKQIETARGVAWSATLTRDGRAVGRVENLGNGGMTQIYLGEPDEVSALNEHLRSVLPALEAHVAQEQEKSAAQFDAPLPATPSRLDTNGERQEVFADCLADESDLQKAVSRDLNRCTMHFGCGATETANFIE